MGKLNDVEPERRYNLPYTYNKLRGRIVEKYGTQKKFSEAIGLTPQGLSLKMRGETSFSQQDISRWCELLDIETDQISEYFFA